MYGQVCKTVAGLFCPGYMILYCRSGFVKKKGYKWNDYCLKPVYKLQRYGHLKLLL